MKKILVAVLLLIVAVVGYLWIYYDWFCISDEETCNGQMDIDWSKEYEFSNDEIHSSFQAQFESQFIQRLLSSWNITQSHFATKAGESGTYNPPSKIQFITDDTALVYYDDGLVDHISILQLKTNTFVELKNVGVMSTMSLAQWQDLVKTYGDSDYKVSNYQSSDYKNFAKVNSNIFVNPLK